MIVTSFLRQDTSAPHSWPRVAFDGVILLYAAAALSGLYFVLLRSGSKIFDAHWGNWINIFQQYGLVQGYYATHDVYPPLTFSLLAGISLLPGDQYANFKLLQLIATFCSGLVVLLWRRDLALAVGTVLALTPNSIVFESTDIFYTPMVIGALIMAADRRWALFSALYAGALLVKWQPVLLAPFLLLWILPDLKSPGTWARLLLPALAVLTPVLVVFGPEFILSLFQAFGAHSFFSGRAFNLNWFTGALQALLTRPEAHMDDVIDMMFTVPPAMWMAAKLLSFASYVAIVGVFCLAGRTARDLLLFCGLAALSYFTLHTEVHENHLHMVVICFALLACVSARHIPMFVFWSAAQAINLMTIISGWPQVIGGLDWTLVIALVNVAVFTWLLVDTLAPVAKPHFLRWMHPYRPKPS